MIIDQNLKAEDLKSALSRFWELSGQKIRSIETGFDTKQGAPVFTVAGQYTSRGWTEWTQGFQYGSALLQYDATGNEAFLEIGRNNTINKMAPHITHIGVHDHGFNNVSTYGNLLRLMLEGKVEYNQREKELYELALKASGAVQAMRWTSIPDGGFIYSFNGPHSLFVDTIRSCRALMVSHLLGHHLSTDHDEKINLLDRAAQHMMATAKYAVYYGDGRDTYDVSGRTAHESVFNTNDGHYRCPNAQQGFSGFTTWTRGLAWAMTGFAEELELLDLIPEADFSGKVSKKDLIAASLKAAKVTCDFYIENTPIDGVPYWDTGAPRLHLLGNYMERASDPYNDFEPIDSSAAAIGAQGLLRFGNYLKGKGDESGQKYWQAGLLAAKSIFSEPYLSTSENHQGLILHSIYHQPNGWDHVPKGSKIANGEASMWGDYHARELALYLNKVIAGERYYTFYNCVEGLVKS